MKFAFLVHPLGEETDRLMACFQQVDPQASFRRGPSAIFHDLHVATAGSPGGPAVRVVDEMPGLRSKSGASVDGRLYEIPMHSRAILDDSDQAVRHMLDAVSMAHAWGAGIVGLGAMTGVVGGRGAYLTRHGKTPVTTGNGLTVYAAIANLEAVCRDLDIDLAEERVVVVGAPGSIASAAARILRPRCRSLILVAHRPSARAAVLAEELGAELLLDVDEALARTRIALSATSSGGCIAQSKLQPGTIVSDIGVPADVLGGHPTRPDVLILSGGQCVVPSTMPLTSRYLWFHRGTMAACLAETVVLALDESLDRLSLGRDLDVDRIVAIGQRAEAHGFSFSRPFSFGQPLDDSLLSAFRKHATKIDRRWRPEAPAAKKSPGKLASERFRRHVNPAMLAVGGDLIKTFVRGEGSRLWDVDGNVLLDFVAGFGSLNLGHNHPAVVSALRSTLTDQPPGFAPAAVNPYAAALAERLVSLAPAGLEMVFFTNSGTESVEAMIKLARLATARQALLSCERSFHGKTLGSLSITGNPVVQRPFAPLIAECDRVAFGDRDALAQALATRRYAAFIVEPMQCEGGMLPAPPGYLRAAQDLCRQSGTLFAVDEVQTGLGRTGALFAVDHESLEPDLMALAKSLGGGIMPIGAMLARREHWNKAYGALDTFALHTSTFGGGSLACAAALATLEVLASTDLVANAAARGEQIATGLKALATRHPVIKEVRGMGLLIGVEFQAPPPSIVTLWRGLLFPDGGALASAGLDDLLRALNATWTMALLQQEHGVYTQVARSNPTVLRIEPPLILTEAEASQFLGAFAACLEEVETNQFSIDQLVAKASRGLT